MKACFNEEPFLRIDLRFVTPKLTGRDVKLLSKHTNLSIEIILQSMFKILTIFKDQKTIGDQTSLDVKVPLDIEETWLAFTEELRDIGFENSELFPLNFVSEQSVPTYKIDETQLQLIVNPNGLIGVYRKKEFLFFTRKWVDCTAGDLQPKETIIGDVIHSEDFVTSGYICSTGKMSGIKEDLIVRFELEEDVLWTRITKPLIYVSPERGLLPLYGQDEELKTLCRRICEHFDMNDSSWALDLNRCGLSKARKFSIKNNIFRLHPFYIPYTNSHFLSILSIALSLAYQ
jgi:hypothetical protein